MDIVIGGSYHKFLKDINKLHDKLEKSGHRVLAPIRCARESKVDKKYDYVLFQGEEEENPIDVQNRFMEKIHNADAFVVCNKNGYMGQTVSLELGWAFAAIKNNYGRLKQIYLTDTITLLNTIKSKGKVLLQDIEDDSQFQYYKKCYGSDATPTDYLELIGLHILFYESSGALKVGIGELLSKDKRRDEEGR